MRWSVRPSHFLGQYIKRWKVEVSFLATYGNVWKLSGAHFLWIWVDPRAILVGKLNPTPVGNWTRTTALVDKCTNHRALAAIATIFCRGKRQREYQDLYEFLSKTGIPWLFLYHSHSLILLSFIDGYEQKSETFRFSGEISRHRGQKTWGFPSNPWTNVASLTQK